MRIAIVAGELSGDLLGGGLIRALRTRFPDARFEGIGGPGMIAEGLESLYPLETLSVMGLVEVLGHLPRLLKIRRDLAKRYLADPPDCFIGIDAPDFNLGLEERLRGGGIKTVHYVSPTVWAWRQGRIHQIKRAVDLMLTVFPFEADFYRQHGVPVEFVGHPAASRFPLEHDVAAARQALGQGEGPLVALLPGSRSGEVNRLAPVFAQAAARLLAGQPECRFVVPVASARVGECVRSSLEAAGVASRTQLLDGQSHLAMGAADVVLAASGTATLEAMLLKRPTVVAYKVAPITYFVYRYLGLVKVRRVAMPNLLADEELMPEFIQGAATPERLAAAAARLLLDHERAARVQQRCLEIHRQLRQDSDKRAAEAIAGCLQTNCPC
jgi:lipid-A-disaccharide synthase